MNWWTEPMLTSLPILVILSPSNTLMIKLKIKVQHEILLNSFTFSHHHLISSLGVYFISTKKEHFLPVTPNSSFLIAPRIVHLLLVFSCWLYKVVWKTENIENKFLCNIWVCCMHEIQICENMNFFNCIVKQTDQPSKPN